MIASYQAKLEKEFSGRNIKFIVEKKADANYAPCSAASVGKYKSDEKTFLFKEIVTCSDLPIINFNQNQWQK